MTALGAARHAAGLIPSLAVSLGGIAGAGLVLFATPQWKWAGAGLMLLAGAGAVLVRGRRRGDTRWAAAAEALIAASLFMNAAMEWRHWTPDWTLVSDSIRAIAVACVVISAVLMLRSGRLSFRRRLRPGRGQR